MIKTHIHSYAKPVSIYLYEAFHLEGRTDKLQYRRPHLLLVGCMEIFLPIIRCKYYQKSKSPALGFRLVSRYSKLNTSTLIIQCQGHTWWSHLRWNRYACFSCRGKRIIFGWDIANFIFDLENSNPKHWFGIYRAKKCLWPVAALAAYDPVQERRPRYQSSWYKIWYKNMDPDTKDHGANMRPICVLSAPDGPHVGPMNLAIREVTSQYTGCLTFEIYCRHGTLPCGSSVLWVSN